MKHACRLLHYLLLVVGGLRIGRVDVVSRRAGGEPYRILAARQARRSPAAQPVTPQRASQELAGHRRPLSAEAGRWAFARGLGEARSSPWRLLFGGSPVARAAGGAAVTTLSRAAAKRVLGLDERSAHSPEQLKTAFRKAVRRSHPDMKGGSAEQLALVTVAYEVATGQRKAEDERQPSAPRGGREKRRPASGEFDWQNAAVSFGVGLLVIGTMILVVLLQGSVSPQLVETDGLEYASAVSAARSSHIPVLFGSPTKPVSRALRSWATSSESFQSAAAPLLVDELDDSVLQQLWVQRGGAERSRLWIKALGRVLAPTATSDKADVRRLASVVMVVRDDAITAELQPMLSGRRVVRLEVTRDGYVQECDGQAPFGPGDVGLLVARTGTETMRQDKMVDIARRIQASILRFHPELVAVDLPEDDFFSAPASKMLTAEALLPARQTSSLVPVGVLSPSEIPTWALSDA